MSDITGLSLTATVASLRDRSFSSVELTSAYLERGHRMMSLNAYVLATPEKALAMASQSDARIASGEAGALEGAPIAVKDNYCTAGVRTTAGSNILGNFVPTYESFVSARAWSAGAVMLGKTNMDEFGMGSSTEHSCFGPTINPRGLGGPAPVTPGGSSGGSAAAVSAGLCAAALASDTGGSIRQPASFCGVVGFKPTYGLCSRWGVIAYASSLDQPGVLTKTVADTALMMDSLVGHDPRDSTSVSFPARFVDGLSVPRRKLKIGFPAELRELSSGAAVGQVWDRMQAASEAMGHEVVPISLPMLKYALPAYYIVALCEASSNLARYDGIRYGHRAEQFQSIDDLYSQTRLEGFHAETRRRIMLGTFALSAGYYDQYYVKALKVRAKLKQAFDAAFAQVDFMVWPATPTPAFPLGSHGGDPLDMYLEDVFTVPVNLGGLPALCLPVLDTPDGLPMGAQIVGDRFSDVALLAVSARFEEVLGYQPPVAQNL